MKLSTLFPLVAVSTAVVDNFVRTYPFRHISGRPYNVTFECAASGGRSFLPRGDEDDADKARWDKAVCKGATLLDAMAGDEARAGNWFKVQ
jgi:hypothetical protein